MTDPQVTVAWQAPATAADLRAAVLEAELPTATCEAWGRTWRLRQLSAWDRIGLVDRFVGECVGHRALQYCCTLVALSVVDEAGDRVFGDDDIDALMRKDWTALDALAKAATRLNKLDPQAVADAKKN